MDYKDQIKSPKWQKKRLEILKRDEFTCQQCGNKELTLHVHHKHYNKGAMIWDYQGWELTTLCEDCHSVKHDKKETKKTFIDSLNKDQIPDVNSFIKLNSYGNKSNRNTKSY